MIQNAETLSNGIKTENAFLYFTNFIYLQHNRARNLLFFSYTYKTIYY